MQKRIYERAFLCTQKLKYVWTIKEARTNNDGPENNKLHKPTNLMVQSFG